MLSEEWDTVVERIRQIDGFTNFLQAIPFTTLQSAAKDDPVILVNIGNNRSDALILRHAHRPELVCLPGASPVALFQLSIQLYSPLTLDHDRSKRILPVLRKLWDVAVFPVVDKLTALGVAKKTRIWWSTTSELSALPLHAAGPYKHGQANLPDIYISSYTSTLSSLIKARSGIEPRRASPKLLAMGQPNDNLGPDVREELRSRKLCRCLSRGKGGPKNCAVSSPTPPLGPFRLPSSNQGTISFIFPPSWR